MDSQNISSPLPNGNRGFVIQAVLWTECSLAVVIVFLRWYVRVAAKTVGVDDWLALMALVSGGS